MEMPFIQLCLGVERFEYNIHFYIIPTNIINNGEVWTCVVMPYDGTDYGLYLRLRSL